MSCAWETRDPMIYISHSPFAQSHGSSKEILFSVFKMVIIRHFVSDFSDEEDIEVCCDDDDDVQITSSESVSKTYATPSVFFVTIDSQAGQDFPNISIIYTIIWMMICLLVCISNQKKQQ
ncbi:hypothetical protein Lalb_Chr18g0055421 [Lupinus albus]|uniref:Uncharacterized protein n=1 Tax=Lupinus albus TaxID=3870 RepID=A0A6A4NZK3_LUPAL|nr:hypothetical protein Lalb_Chr18g0055421 [Lupinus albus]